MTREYTITARVVEHVDRIEIELPHDIARKIRDYTLYDFAARGGAVEVNSVNCILVREVINNEIIYKLVCRRTD